MSWVNTKNLKSNQIEEISKPLSIVDLRDRSIHNQCLLTLELELFQLDIKSLNELDEHLSLLTVRCPKESAIMRWAGN